MAVRRQGFRQDGQGNVALLTAICGMVLVLAMGSALDVGRAYAVRYALQAALDTAAITAAQYTADNDVKRTSPALQAKARTYLIILSQRMVNANSNLPADAAVVSAPQVAYSPGSLRVREKVVVSLDVAVPTTFLKGMGQPLLTFTVTSEAYGK